MSSRFTIDTTYLKIRDVFAFNANSGEVIQRDSVPVIGDSGHIDWKNSLEFISSISVPTLSTTVLNLLTMIQPGLSTLSTTYFSTTASYLQSTVEGLGSLPNGNDYISSSKLLFTVNRLAGDYGYISSTNLYDCINRLGNLNTIGPILNIPGSNFDARGYVSTLHPGEYRIYQSSLLLQGANLVNTPINTNVLTVTNIDVGGYASHIVPSSKMRIDINTNMNITHTTSVQRNLSTFLTPYLSNLPVGSPVVLNYTATGVNLPSMSFILNATDLSDLIGPLQLKCSTDSTGFITTVIPDVGGIHITLDNTD
jgi:hypothetical protein